MQSQGFLEVVAPPPGDEERLESVARQFLDWGDLHRQGVGIRAARSARSGGGGASPAFDEETCAQIVAEVKRRSQPSDASRGFDPLVPARLFLHLAQEFDRQSRELQSELDGFARRSVELFDSLKGRAAPLESTAGSRRAETPEHIRRVFDRKPFERLVAALSEPAIPLGCFCHPSPRRGCADSGKNAGSVPGPSGRGRVPCPGGLLRRRAAGRRPNGRSAVPRCGTDDEGCSGRWRLRPARGLRVAGGGAAAALGRAWICRCVRRTRAGRGPELSEHAVGGRGRVRVSGTSGTGHRREESRR